MNKSKIAIILPTIDSANIMSWINNVIEHYQDNWYIIIVDGSSVHDTNKEVLYHAIASQFHKEEDKRITVIKEHGKDIPDLINVGIKEAKNKKCDYCLISYDCVYLQRSVEKINDMFRYFKRYDLIGFHIINVKNNMAKYKDGKKHYLKTCSTCNPKKIIIYNCDTLKYFFLAKTNTLNTVIEKDPDDFFRKYNKKYKVGFTTYIKGEYKNLSERR